jgi:hypothetical protein
MAHRAVSFLAEKARSNYERGECQAAITYATLSAEMED